jgi:hypothetical protein
MASHDIYKEPRGLNIADFFEALSTDIATDSSILIESTKSSV